MSFKGRFAMHVGNSLVIRVLTLCLLCLGATATGQENSQESKRRSIGLKEIDGKDWLIDAQGKPFFAHGVTHAGNVKSGVGVAAIGRACGELGFNAYGYGCPPPLKQDRPYVEGRNLLPLSTYRTSDGSFSYVDIFDPKVQARIDADIKKLCLANRNNPNLIGYCWTDLGAWPLKNSTGKNWVQFIRELPDGSPGKKAYDKFLAEWKGVTQERDEAFLRVIAKEYFRVHGTANRKYDPNHLIFGDRFSIPTVSPVVIEEMIPYVDAIAIQPQFKPGFPKQAFERIHRLSGGKPILICDFAIRFKDGDKSIRGWKPEASAKIAGEKYSAYIREAMKTSYVVGAFWCNPIDSTPGFKKKGIKQGLFGVGLAARPELHQSIRKLNEFIKQQTPELDLSK